MTFPYTLPLRVQNAQAFWGRGMSWRIRLGREGRVRTKPCWRSGRNIFGLPEIPLPEISSRLRSRKFRFRTLALLDPQGEGEELSLPSRHFQRGGRIDAAVIKGAADHHPFDIGFVFRDQGFDIGNAADPA